MCLLKQDRKVERMKTKIECYREMWYVINELEVNDEIWYLLENEKDKNKKLVVNDDLNIILDTNNDSILVTLKDNEII